MKIAFTGLPLPEGKTKYNDPTFTRLAEKFQPEKQSPYYFELLPDAYEAAEAIAIAADRVLDLLIHDIEKTENRIARVEDAAERGVLERCLGHMESEQPACDLAFDEDERTIVKAFGLMSFKPTVVFPEPIADVDAACRAVLDKANMMFFYTAGKREVHAWLVERGADAVTCAGKIHTDLARGFIKAELVALDDLLASHSMQDARTKGLVRLVDRDVAVPENTILEIRFNV
ncbi:MAG: DUF933 domain-containing protein [Armatimonadetes bacterium]|nr:DUF933 domain-containing protein [Armatimonadota bacterium]